MQSAQAIYSSFQGLIYTHEVIVELIKLGLTERNIVIDSTDDGHTLFTKVSKQGFPVLTLTTQETIEM